ncbi:CPBP family intramembrane metalloprotease [Clostridium sp. YIM B02515]|uniref:CPBP family intramembrane metalloprotease n=1 Tax=Clostridium rhizosphaerae TaxID=2803861 RepID=A0ABS1TIV1_9CLOT|nr:type II CAAX endopeptidase family protein [Clostridium rhizosphaerae]MBL4937883.1 CPBP family intramembrane metalloprotease [Clostridium rhizosphaerae]
MFNLNPLKFIMHIENEDGEFRGLGLGGSFCISVAYIIFLSFYGAFNMIPSICSIENLVVLSIYSVIITILFFSLFVVVFLAKFYIPKFDTKDVTESESKVNYRNIIFLILFTVGCKLIFDATLIPIIKMTSSFSFIVNSLRDMAKIPALLICYEIVIGPIIEEILFRGIMLNGLMKRYSNKMAIITSSLIFGLVHFNVYQLCMAFLFGIFLAFLYLKTHSIILCIFAHVFHNIYTTFILLFLPKYFSIINNNILTIFLFSILGLLLMLISINKIIYYNH